MYLQDRWNISVIGDCNFDGWKIKGELGTLEEFTRCHSLSPEEGVKAHA